MLLGAKLFVYTDHRNLTHKLSQFTTQRVLRWRLLLEEYGPTFAYQPGPQNVIADALSRVPTTLVNFLVNMPTAQSPRPPPVPGPSSTSHIDSYSSLLSSPDMASHLTTYLPLAEGLLAMPERVAQDSEAVESEAPTNSNTPLLSDSEAVLHDRHIFLSALRCSRPTAFSLPNCTITNNRTKAFFLKFAPRPPASSLNPLVVTTLFAIASSRTQIPRGGSPSLMPSSTHSSTGITWQLII